MVLVEPDERARREMVKLLDLAGLPTALAAAGDDGLRALATNSPSVLITALAIAPPGRDGVWLLRRLRDEYMGARPRVLVTSPPGGIDTRLADLGVDAVLLAPVLPGALLAAVDDSAWASEHAHDAEKLRELIRASLLSGDPEESFAAVAKRLSLSFRMRECVIVATLGDRQVVGCAVGPIDESPEAALWDHCQSALAAGAPLLVPEAGKTLTYIAVPIESLGGTQLGVVLLIDDKPRLLAPEMMDSLRALGQRLYGELAWRSVHDRIAADRDRLRESSMLDPMLGVWTRAALEQALPGEVAACQRRREPMCFVVLNLRGLKHLNERYGHLVGDEALRHVSSIVRAGLRTQDLVARYGGDALVLVLAGAGARDGRVVIERIAQEIARIPLEYGEQTIAVQVVAGLSPLLNEDDTGESAIARALAAVGLAKRRREAVVVLESLDEAAGQVAASPSLEPGTTLGGMYQILHEISRGAMGVVYRAEDLGLGRPVALKTLRHDLARDRNFVERFRIEAATLAAIRHEHLVQVYHFGSDGEDVFFVMELVEGEPLEDRVELARHEGKFMSYAMIAQVVVQIGDALDAMHRAGIMHRDVKPANILVDRERGRAVLVDVGIAKRRGTAHDPAGTPGFTAPESFVGGAEGPASDVYGLAATAYTLMTGNAPFGEGSIEAILARQQRTGPTPPRTWRAELSDELEHVLVQAMDPAAAARHASAGEFARAFASACRGMPSGADGLDTGRYVVPVPQAPEITFEPVPRPATRVPGLTGTRVMPGQAPSDGVPVPMVSRKSGPVIAAPAASQPLRLPALREPEAPVDGSPHTRGVLFRSAFRVLGARQGNAWVTHVSRKNAALAKALQPQNTLLSWHPTELFLQMLRAIKDSGRDPRAFGRELGRVAASTTFTQFLGADPAALQPGEVLASTNLFLRRYHTWGEATVERVGETECLVTVSGGPADELVWPPTAGILEQVAVLSGAAQSSVEVVDRGASPSCRFRVKWQMARAGA